MFYIDGQRDFSKFSANLRATRPRGITGERNDKEPLTAYFGRNFEIKAIDVPRVAKLKSSQASEFEKKTQKIEETDHRKIEIKFSHSNPRSCDRENSRFEKLKYPRAWNTDPIQF